MFELQKNEESGAIDMPGNISNEQKMRAFIQLPMFALDGGTLIQICKKIVNNYQVSDVIEIVPLFSNDLNDVLSNLEESFNKTLIFIVNTKNTDLSEKEQQILQQHWFCVVRTREKELFSFDSYGRPIDEILAGAGVTLSPEFRGIRSVSPQRMQFTKSAVCGHYIIQFILFLAQEKNIYNTWKNFRRYTIPIQESLFPSMNDIDRLTTVNDYIILKKTLEEFPELQ